MATVMQMHWRGVSKQQYTKTRKMVNWEGDAPKGAKFHVAWFAKDGIHVLDVWDSRKNFERFLKTRLAPATQKLGIKGQPKIRFVQAHEIFAPDV